MSARRTRIWCAAALFGTACAGAPTPATAPASLDVTSEATTTTTTVAAGSATTAAPTADASAPSTERPPTTPSTPTSPVSTVPTVTPQGFGTSAAVVTKPDGETCELCVWVADDSAQRARGLMHVTDLGEASAMAFVYPSPHTGTFWMKDTLLPLSIAFFTPDGDYLDAFDMAPCSLGDDCPDYRTPADFLVAVEVPQGELDRIGLVRGSRFELIDAACGET